MDIQTPSKQKIIHGVTELLKEKSLANIKVADITERSGVSHQTFYRVFADKYDACECACHRLLSAAALIVGSNSTVREHTFCTLNIIKTNAGFFRHLLDSEDGVDVVKRALRHLSEESINFRSESPIMNSWIFCLQEWSKAHFKTPMEDVYHRIISCYPLNEVVFGQELIDIMDKYGQYTMQELESSVNARSRLRGGRP